MVEEDKPESELELSRALANDIAQITVRTPEMDFVDLVTAYKSVEDTHLRNVRGDPFRTLETKRRVAERILHAAIDKRRSFEECQQYLSELLKLGFTNLELKGRALVILSKYYFEIRRNQEAIDLLRPLKAELEQEFARTGLEVYRDLLQNTETVLNELGAPQTETS